MNIVKSYSHIEFDNDHYICQRQQIIYQKDMTQSVPYAEQYFEKYVLMENTDIAKKINNARVEITKKYCNEPLLDVGIGSGEFIKNHPNKVYGFDINPLAVAWLKEKEIFVDPYVDALPPIGGWTFWDVIEHIPEPQDIFCKIPSGHFLFTSIPIFNDIRRIKESKHFRPNEHYYYFSLSGFIQFMNDSGFAFLEYNDSETEAGREAIGTFAFKKK